MDDSARTIKMMDASSRAFDMSDVAAAIAEADELPVWSADSLEEYFSRESLEVNEAGEILVTLKHGDSNILITPEHSLYARLKAIIDSGASVCIFNQPKYFQDFVEHPITICTAGNYRSRRIWYCREATELSTGNGTAEESYLCVPCLS